VTSGNLSPGWGIARTRRTDSAATVSQWLVRHPLNSDVEILHDPAGPKIKIAGELFWLVYPVAADCGQKDLVHAGFHDVPTSSHLQRSVHDVAVRMNGQEHDLEPRAGFLQLLSSLDAAEN
jgi:hypothetical protein